MQDDRRCMGHFSIWTIFLKQSGVKNGEGAKCLCTYFWKQGNPTPHLMENFPLYDFFFPIQVMLLIYNTTQHENKLLLLKTKMSLCCQCAGSAAPSSNPRPHRHFTLRFIKWFASLCRSPSTDNNEGCKLTTSIVNSFLINPFLYFCCTFKDFLWSSVYMTGHQYQLCECHTTPLSVVTTLLGLPDEALNPHHMMRDLPPLQLVPLSQTAILLMKCLPSSSSLHYASVSLEPPFCSPYHVAG